MTTIAYRNGVVAADRQAWLGRGEPTHCAKTKLHGLYDGRIAGVSSSIVGAGGALFAWLDAGEPADCTPLIKDDSRENDFEMIVVSSDGTIMYYKDNFLPTMVEAEYFAIGSGCAYALGAMAAGAEAPGAVSIAGGFDAFTGKGMDIWRLTESHRERIG